MVILVYPGWSTLPVYTSSLLPCLPCPRYTTCTPQLLLVRYTCSVLVAVREENVLGSEASGSLGEPLLLGSLGQSCLSSARVLTREDCARVDEDG